LDDAKMIKDMIILFQHRLNVKEQNAKSHSRHERGLSILAIIFPCD